MKKVENIKNKLPKTVANKEIQLVHPNLGSRISWLLKKIVSEQGGQETRHKERQLSKISALMENGNKSYKKDAALEYSEF